VVGPLSTSQRKKDSNICFPLQLTYYFKEINLFEQSKVADVSGILDMFSKGNFKEFLCGRSGGLLAVSKRNQDSSISFLLQLIYYTKEINLF